MIHMSLCWQKIACWKWQDSSSLLLSETSRLVRRSGRSPSWQGWWTFHRQPMTWPPSPFLDVLTPGLLQRTSTKGCWWRGWERTRKRIFPNRTSPAYVWNQQGRNNWHRTAPNRRIPRSQDLCKMSEKKCNFMLGSCHQLWKNIQKFFLFAFLR